MLKRMSRSSLLSNGRLKMGLRSGIGWCIWDDVPRLESAGEQRIPPLSFEKWSAIDHDVFRETANVVFFSDGSVVAYRGAEVRGAVQRERVSHSVKEFARSRWLRL